ncbi:3-hydroxybutyrate dehydrogenase [Sandaracinobacter sp. RS1-74]|uniref:3-hydroxybutyrate dehydrogenase n=1 Tax=Sandaracinobacteroides sayramensis TaxID=2913411 RepID=UPI001EDC2430|nr:3-hydroxybutyrate dehydrogenase [Sandaracinobacteroides sayramensis]MCG2840162.1 3-hydroxybutyrate dehydrogenase [Sandaracinobacteroides sayramensis]
MADTPDALRPLSGRRAAVTGSTSGIGLAVAEALAKAGADVAINGFGDHEPALRQVGAHGTKVVFAGADLSKGAEAQAFVADVQKQLGGLDILVNNAGIQHVAPVDEFPDDKWDAILAINLSSNFHTMKAAIPAMKAQNWGRIVNIASAHGLVASPFKSAYVAAKHGVLGLTKSAALELAETLVTVNTVCPGFVDTPLVRGQIADQAKVNDMSEEDVVKNIILASQPTKRFITAEQVAGTVLFLCSDAASGVTGSSFSIDGGWTAR